MNNSLACALAVSLVLSTSTCLAQQKMGDMKGMDMSTQGPAATSATHKTVAVVKTVDAKKGTVTLDHEPVPSMNWSAMTMSFKVADKQFFDKLTVGSKVEVEFKQLGKDYVITSVK